MININSVWPRKNLSLVNISIPTSYFFHVCFIASLKRKFKPFFCSAMSLCKDGALLHHVMTALQTKISFFPGELIRLAEGIL